MFKKASKTKSRARVALIGPSGSGKTYSALSIATGLGGRVAVIDTEHGSAAKYADLFDFDVCELESDHSPTRYIEALSAAASESYDVVVIDSMSHAWMGANGALEQVDQRKKSNNSWAAWADVTPIHRSLIEAILRSPAHVIATLRSRTEWVIETDSRGRNVPRKIGMAPVQRDGVEFEFDLVVEIDNEHSGRVTKTRCSSLDGRCLDRPGADVGRELLVWLTDGATPPSPPPAQPTVEDLVYALRAATDRASYEAAVSDIAARRTEIPAETLASTRELARAVEERIRGAS